MTSGCDCLQHWRARTRHEPGSPSSATTRRCHRQAKGQETLWRDALKAGMRARPTWPPLVPFRRASLACSKSVVRSWLQSAAIEARAECVVAISGRVRLGVSMMP